MADGRKENVLKDRWQGGFCAEIQKRMWNAKAKRYSQKNIPDMQTDFFLRQLVDGGPNREDTAFNGVGSRAAASFAASFSAEEMKTWSVLDVGCGAGLYSVAISPFVQRVTGVDISENMIAFAKEKARAAKRENCEFLCLDWTEADLDKLGMHKAFDMVFVHMSPAVHDFETFDKLVRAGTKRCVFAVNTRRTDKILDSVLTRAGILDVQKNRDRQIPHIFEYLWEKGFCPHVRYERELWQSEYTAQEMRAWCLDRARLHCPLTKEQENGIVLHVEELAEQSENKVLREEIAVTTVVFDWRLDR